MAFPVMAIPGIIGAIGSLFKKKKPKNQTQYSTMYSPQQQAMYNQYLPMIMRMFQQSQQPPQGQANQFLGQTFFK